MERERSCPQVTPRKVWPSQSPQSDEGRGRRRSGGGGGAGSSGGGAGECAQDVRADLRRVPRRVVLAAASAHPEEKGHKVYAPSLTGNGDRMHLISKDITLDTQATDIVNLVTFEDLKGICLVAHSFGGWPVSR